MKLHTTLSAELNPTALLFKKPFHLHLVFHNACLNELCEFMSADRGVLSIQYLLSSYRSFATCILLLH